MTDTEQAWIIAEVYLKDHSLGNCIAIDVVGSTNEQQLVSNSQLY